MRIRSLLPVTVCCVAPRFLLAQAPQHVVAPAAYAATDAISVLWIPGSLDESRQQTLVGASHLTTCVGRALVALELRRSASAEACAGGAADLSITLSTSPSRPLHASAVFTANVGVDAVTVFRGTVAVPDSPGEPGPAVSWAANNTVRIAFQQPFVYQGGTLCLDVVGRTVAGRQTGWWMADAVFEDLAGTAHEVGAGCGPYGGPSARWSWTHVRKLVPGNHARFLASGPHQSFGVAAFGMRSSLPLPLTAFGLPSPNCQLHLGTVDILLPAVFVPEVLPALQAGPAMAIVGFWVPDHSAVFGTTMTTQWFEWSQLATSNAVEWSIAATIPVTDLTTIEGVPASPVGNVAVGHAHVLRFEVQ